MHSRVWRNKMWEIEIDSILNESKCFLNSVKYVSDMI